MKSMHELVGRELVWVQPNALKREFELQDGADVVATLRFRTPLGSYATAETGDGSWTFKRIGFWKGRVTVCPAGTESVIAEFKNRTWKGGGTLEFPDGRKFPATTQNWMTSFEFRSDRDEPLIRFHKIRGVIFFGSKVEIIPPADSLAELPWLVPLGWYLTVKMHDDAGGMAAAASAAAAAG